MMKYVWRWLATEEAKTGAASSGENWKPRFNVSGV